jgi:hypothetical protein
MHGGIEKMGNPGNRRYQRIPIKLDLSCHKIGSFAEKWYAGRTINISPGGLYFQTTTNEFKPGDFLNVEFLIQPRTGLLEYGGRISGFARVLRADDVGRSHAEVISPSGRSGVAVQFCQSPKLCS